ncbi:MAG: hypothetical protein ACQESN_06295 [Thermotogota bacterium]
MDKLLVQMFNSIFMPVKSSNEIKKSFYIPLIIIFIYLISPQVINGLDFIYFILMFTYLSNGLRFIFSKKHISYLLLAASMPLIFGVFSDLSFLIASLWSLGLKSYYEIKYENYYSFTMGLAFDVLIIWWYL